jgi:hypothetical protein
MDIMFEYEKIENISSLTNFSSLKGLYHGIEIGCKRYD